MTTKKLALIDPDLLERLVRGTSSASSPALLNGQLRELAHLEEQMENRLRRHSPRPADARQILGAYNQLMDVRKVHKDHYKKSLLPSPAAAAATPPAPNRSSGGPRVADEDATTQDPG